MSTRGTMGNLFPSHHDIQIAHGYFNEEPVSAFTSKTHGIGLGILGINLCHNTVSGWFCFTDDCHTLTCVQPCVP